MIITAIFSPEQDPTTGEIVLDHIHKSLKSYLALSDQFDLTTHSELRDTIGKIRNELFAPVTDRANEKLPNGAKVYRIAQPKTVPLNFLRGKIVNAAEITINVNEEVTYSGKLNNALLNASIENYVIYDSAICTPRKQVRLWKHCNYGKKNEINNNLNSTLEQQIIQGMNEATNSK